MTYDNIMIKLFYTKVLVLIKTTIQYVNLTIAYFGAPSGSVKKTGRQ